MLEIVKIICLSGFCIFGAISCICGIYLITHREDRNPELLKRAKNW